MPITQQFLAVLPAGSPQGAQSDADLQELGQEPPPLLVPPDEVAAPPDDPEEPEPLVSVGAADGAGIAEAVCMAAGGALASVSIGNP